METKDKLFKDYRVYITVLFVVILCELIGTKKFPLGPGNVVLLPMLYCMVICLCIYLAKPLNWLKEKQSATAGSLIGIGITLLIAKISITSGFAITEIVNAGTALLLQNLGDLGTVIFALPIALLLGFKRECIGMTHSIGREPNVALVSEKYGSQGAEFRGIMMVYVVGTVFGTVFMGTLSSFLATATPISVEAFAMAAGCGSAGMMTAALAPLLEMYPDMADKLTAYASISNIISSVIGLYLSIFIGLPLTEALYKILEPKIGKKNKN